MPSVFKLTQQWAKDNHLSYWKKEEVSSTNDIAKSEAFSVGHFKLYICNQQSKGRGRGENIWLSECSGSYLLSTWSFVTERAPQHIASPLIGLALFKSAQDSWPNLKWSLKAPNDLYLRNKKIAGLLIENIEQGKKYFTAIGIGMNILNKPKQIKNATFITSEDGTGGFFDEKKMVTFLNSLYKNLQKALEQGVQMQIEKKEREALLIALNTNPLKEEMFIEVTEQGDLITESKLIKWTEL